jgi:hypothetical protein
MEFDELYATHRNWASCALFNGFADSKLELLFFAEILAAVEVYPM